MAQRQFNEMEIATLSNFVSSKEFSLLKEYLIDKAEVQALTLIKRDVKKAEEARSYANIEKMITKLTIDLTIKKEEK